MTRRYVVGYLAGVQAGLTVHWAAIRSADPAWRAGFTDGYVDDAALAVAPAFARSVRKRDDQLTILGAERRTATPRRRWMHGRLAALILPPRTDPWRMAVTR